LRRPRDREHQHVVADARAGEAPEPEVARQTFHLGERVVDDSVPAARCRAERDESRSEGVGAGARMPADEPDLLERAGDGVRAGVAEVRTARDLGE